MCSEIGRNEVLVESHVFFKCKMLCASQQRLGLARYTQGQKGCSDPRDLLYKYLGGDGADAKVLLRRGKALVEMMGEFHSRMDMTL